MSMPGVQQPLIAKQGSEKEWHFAHEAGQERPECLSGALNMLRRLVVEKLKRHGQIDLPPYRVSVFAQSPMGKRSESVEWLAQFQSPLAWSLKAPRHLPVATGLLTSGVEAAVFVEIGEGSAAEVACTSCAAALAFVCPVPLLEDLRERARAEQHIDLHGRFEWRWHPDTYELRADAQARVDALARQDADV